MAKGDGEVRPVAMELRMLALQGATMTRKGNSSVILPVSEGGGKRYHKPLRVKISSTLEFRG